MASPRLSSLSLCALREMLPRPPPDAVLSSSLALWETELASDSGILPSGWSSRVLSAETAAASERRRVSAAAGEPAIETPPSQLGGGVLVVSSDLGVAGAPTTAGLHILSAGRATEDAAVVASMRRAGAQLLGQAAQAALSMGVATPGVKNPWTSWAQTGGTQGGVAAAISTRLAAVGLALDAEGGAVVSAALCGVVCFRPSSGRYDLSGALTLSPTLEQLVVVARLVEDAALVDSVLAEAGEATTPPLSGGTCEAAHEASPTASAASLSAPDCSLAPALVGERIGVPRSSALFSSLATGHECVRVRGCRRGCQDGGRRAGWSLRGQGGTPLHPTISPSPPQLRHQRRPRSHEPSRGGAH